MKMKPRLATLLVILATTGPLLSATEVERLRNLCAEQEMQIRQLELKISQLTDTPPPSPSSVSKDNAVRATEPAAGTYKVKAGDSIERIARNYGVSIAALTKLNGIKTDTIIHAGQTIKIPGAATHTASEPVKMEARQHTVASGETFFKIAQKHGVSVEDLIAVNPSVKPNALRVGQKINISKAYKAVAKSSVPAAAEPGLFLSRGDILPISNIPAPVEKPRATDKPVRINKEITYGAFAKSHNTTTRRLDELNGLELDPSTVLAQGSELYLPAQP